MHRAPTASSNQTRLEPTTGHGLLGATVPVRQDRLLLNSNSQVRFCPSYVLGLLQAVLTGVAFSVYFVLANIVPGAETKTKAHFILDGFEVETFQHQPVADSPTFQYDSLVFHAQDLEDRQHLLTIMAHDPEDEMWIAFDYAIYL